MVSFKSSDRTPYQGLQELLFISQFDSGIRLTK